MALVMLPSDLPWWDSVKKQLKKIAQTKNTMELINGMQKIYEMCNISLDPDDDTVDPDHFVEFLNFIDNDLTTEERGNFLNKTLPTLVAHALKLKELRPKGGLHFSLQQQADCTELEYSFVTSLLANAFFSTFPKRTDKSHPTLQNFNFADFFKTLMGNNTQKAKLKSFFYYFDWIDEKDNHKGKLRVLRQVMSSKEWLTIEDWLECTLPLCSLKIKHDGRLETSGSENLQICFASSKIGGSVLGNGSNQESINLVTMPELMAVLLNVEALEDNEVLTVEKVRQISRIRDPKQRANLEKLETYREITVCCADAEDYTNLPIGQYEEDNILRELNKCLLAFQQKQWKTVEPGQVTAHHNFISRHRRLSPIGESVGSNQSDSVNPKNVPIITQQSCSTMSTRSDSVVSESNETANKNRLRVKLEMERSIKKMGSQSNIDTTCLINNRKGKFIVLGSSGECLPVSRKPLLEHGSQYSSCDESTDEEFLSACTSLDDGSDEENYDKKYSSELETAERRQTFAQRLRDALRREKEYGENSISTSQDSSYAMDIRVAGSGVNDQDIKVRRCASTGFALKEDSIDEEFLQNSLQQEKQWVDKFRNKQSARSRLESNKSSDYSVSTEYSSELEEVYEQFSRWLDNPILETEKGTKKELDARDLAVVQFAGSLLKRTLSESFAGVPVPLTESGESTSGKSEDFSTKKNKLVLNAKSLSLELARQKHRLAAQLSAAIESHVEVANNLPLTNEINSVGCEQANVTENRRVWFLTCVNEAIIQTLEDVCYCINLPKDKQLSQISRKTNDDGLRPVATGNWGCGSSRKGDVQLKVIIQWLAASVAGVPYLLYYSCGHQQLTKLDTVCRILIDRKWTVKDLVEAALRYSTQVLRGRELSGTLFEDLIGIDKTSL